MRWLRAHPLKACGFSMTFGYLAAACSAAFSMDDIHPYSRWLVLGLLVAVWLTYTIIYYADLKKLTAAVVAATMFSTSTVNAQAPPREHPALVIGVLAVIVVGGWAGCKGLKKCKNAVAGRTNAWPEELNFQVAGGDPYEYGAVFGWLEDDYCEAQRLTAPAVPVAFTIEIIVNSVSNCTTAIRADTGQQFVRSFSEFTEEMAEHGLNVPTIGTMSSFERNRHPVSAEQVAISFNFDTRTVTLGSGGVLVTVERSGDLREWEPLMRINAEEGARLRVEDASEQAMFYRVTTEAR